MNDQYAAGTHPASSPASWGVVGYYSAILAVLVTIITFGFALIAIPISGANCPGDCVTYPYLDTASQFPRDFVWMLPAMVLVLVFVALIASVHTCAPPHKKAFSQIGLVFAIISAVILLLDYYVQFSVVPVSLMANETEGIPLLIQYNPHGIFIALEELGYLMMSLSFLLIAPVFTEKNRVSTAIRWVLIVNFGVIVIALAAIALGYGLERLDRFEVVVITMNWLVLIVGGALLSIWFRRQREAGI